MDFPPSPILGPICSMPVIRLAKVLARARAHAHTKHAHVIGSWFKGLRNSLKVGWLQISWQSLVMAPYLCMVVNFLETQCGERLAYHCIVCIHQWIPLFSILLHPTLNCLVSPYIKSLLYPLWKTKINCLCFAREEKVFWGSNCSFISFVHFSIWVVFHFLLSIYKITLFIFKKISFVYVL